MRFEVPQFINIEDKLFGPFTFKQSLYLVGGGGLVYFIYKVVPGFLAHIIALPVAGFALALVFYRPNGRPFIKLVEAFIFYIFSDKFYLWRKRDQKEQKVANVQQVHGAFPKEGEFPDDDPHKKIDDIAWSLDILDFEE